MNEENNIDAYQPTFQPGALRDPVWYEGQTVFEMGNGKISWKNNIYHATSLPLLHLHRMRI